MTSRPAQSARGQHDRAVLGDRDGVLHVRAAGAVGAAEGPAVAVGVDLVGRLQEPRLDRDHQPGPQRVAAARPAVVGHVRVAVHRATDPVAAEAGVDREPLGAGDLRRSPRRCRRSCDPAFAAPIAASSARVGGVDEVEVALVRRTDDQADRGVRDPAVDGAGEVEAEQVAVAQHVVERQPVQHRVVDRGAQHLAEGHRAEGGVVVDVAGLGPPLADHLVRERVEVEQVDPHVGGLGQAGEHLADEAPGGSHLLDLGRGTQLDHGASLRSPYAR